MSEALKLGDIRITGTKAEITNTLTILRAKGCVWNSKEKYHPQRGDATKFAYYLNSVTAPLLIPSTSATTTQSNNEPQPRSYDAVLGGKRRSDKT
ncbi:MAG: hypothetical protein ACRC62_27630 [Microcoleus sp.]